MAVDEVVRGVAVPRRGPRRAGFLHEDVLVEQLDGLGAHQVGGDGRRVGLEGEALELRDPGPVAVVVPEPTGVVGRAVVIEVLAGVGLQPGDAVDQRVDPAGEGSPEQHCAVLGVGRHERGVEWQREHRSRLGPGRAPDHLRERAAGGVSYGEPMHRVTLREMEHFVALAEHGSVTGAAAIGLSQPAMSTSLRDLERTLGVTLFVRHRGRGGEPAA